ncbi:M48 family metallopeptidase [Asaia prunellae]|uniref:M48 family metallopeptidase n=1 Tax=Asaia prunellae TaxID=610245 RepID=UPI002435AF53|nr:M48 family metallopeptidase [Asaia prunellae]
MALFRSNEINAWVMPGGRVGVYTGLIQTLHLSDAEVAAVLGHEMIHALEEHSKEKAGQQTLSSLATVAMSAYAGSNAGALLGAASQMGIGLPFSRRLETRADLGGLMIMAQAGYDPHAAISLWQKMASLKGQSNTGGLARFLSDHPEDAERQKAIEAALPRAMALYNQAQHPA